MPEQYAHTLIPDAADFIPQPQRVAAFFESLVDLGAAPIDPKLRVLKPSGNFRSLSNPFTGHTESVPVSEHVVLGEVREIQEAVKDLQHYDVKMLGQGPPRVPPLRLQLRQPRHGRLNETDGTHVNEWENTSSDWTGTYAFDISCFLRPEVVSTSSTYSKTRVARAVPFFGQIGASKDRIGIFQHPYTGTIIEVANAGSARFWVEFEFGKWLFPRINDSLNLLEPSIVSRTEECFGTRFVQGCHLFA